MVSMVSFILAAIRSCIELLAEILNRHHRRITRRMNVRGLEYSFLLGNRWPARERSGSKDRGGEEGNESLHISGPPGL